MLFKFKLKYGFKTGQTAFSLVSTRVEKNDLAAVLLLVYLLLRDRQTRASKQKITWAYKPAVYWTESWFKRHPERVLAAELENQTDQISVPETVA